MYVLVLEGALAVERERRRKLRVAREHSSGQRGEGERRGDRDQLDAADDEPG